MFSVLVVGVAGSAGVQSTVWERGASIAMLVGGVVMGAAALAVALMMRDLPGEKEFERMGVARDSKSRMD